MVLSIMNSSTPDRLVPEIDFPDYAFVPGYWPHPRNDPEGHSFNTHEPDPTPLDPDDWNQSRIYLYGLDLFNHGYYWEAHEQWEALWLQEDRNTPIAQFLEGLIRLTAAGVKARQQNPKGIQNHASGAKDLFQTVQKQTQLNHYAGLDLNQLISLTQHTEEHALEIDGNPNVNREIIFGRNLRPDDGN